MNSLNMNIDLYVELIKIVRKAARKYLIKTFEINCIYIAYITRHRDLDSYMSQHDVSRSVARSYYSRNTRLMIDHGLLRRVDYMIYEFTDKSKDIINYINDELEKV